MSAEIISKYTLNKIIQNIQTIRDELMVVQGKTAIERLK